MKPSGAGHESGSSMSAGSATTPASHGLVVAILEESGVDDSHPHTLAFADRSDTRPWGETGRQRLGGRAQADPGAHGEDVVRRDDARTELVVHTFEDGVDVPVVALEKRDTDHQVLDDAHIPQQFSGPIEVTIRDEILPFPVQIVVILPLAPIGRGDGNVVVGVQHEADLGLELVARVTVAVLRHSSIPTREAGAETVRCSNPAGWSLRSRSCPDAQ